MNFLSYRSSSLFSTVFILLPLATTRRDSKNAGAYLLFFILFSLVASKGDRAFSGPALMDLALHWALINAKQSPNNCRERSYNSQPISPYPPANHVHSLATLAYFALTVSITQLPSYHTCALPTTRRKALSLFTFTSIFTGLGFSDPNHASSNPTISDFVELPESGGVKALDLRVGEGGDTPVDGDKVAIHYYGRLAAKQGWRFDSTYDHKDENGEPVPFVFVLGSGKVISGVESAVRSMRVGGIRRIVIPPSQGYQNMSQEPIPPNFFDRQRLFTTIFNPTRLANGEGSTLGTLIFDIELVSLRR